MRYTVVDDFGNLMNPMLAEGQVHGGVAQGIGQAITERVVYDEDGQLLTATFMDYGMPRADDTPFVAFYTEPVPSIMNPLGMKGCGEAGTGGALAAVAHDILISVGVYSIFQFEVTPATVIAFLTIMGYSLYDTIVVYDEVREVTGRLGASERYSYTELRNLALNRVTMRSINTSVSSALPVATILPFLIRPTRSEMAKQSSSSWVTMTEVIPSRCWRERMSAPIRRWLAGSRPVVGSS